MTGASTISPDLASVAPKADASAAAAVPPVAAAPFPGPAPISSRAPNLAELASAGSALSPRVSVKNVSTFLVAAASRIISKSSSLVEA